MKRTPLQRKTPLRNRATRRDRPGKASVEFPPHVKEAARLRSGHRCEARTGKVCTGRIDHHHHILMRSQGGVGTLDNCLCVCSPCHTYIHANPIVSYLSGWLKRSKGVSTAS